MGKRGKLHIFLFILAGALISVMTVFMELGGSVNFQEFMSAGRVYDVEPEQLTKSTEGWLYDWQEGGYFLQSNRAFMRYYLSSPDRGFNYLYVMVEELSQESVKVVVRYYNGYNLRVFKEPITLKQGMNIIELDGRVPVQSLVFVVHDAKGEFISISSIQARTTPSRFTLPHFLSLFGVTLAGALAVLLVITLLYRFICVIYFPEGIGGFYWLLDSMQDSVRIFGDLLGRRMGGKLHPRQRRSVRRFLFCLLLAWMMVGNVAGWLGSAQSCRYHLLACVALLLAISFVSWERPLQNPYWRGALMKSWLFIWLGIVLCDFFVVRKVESLTGYAMLIAGSVFIYFWQNMKEPGQMFGDLLKALEITFLLGLAYCVLFRAKLPAVDYNGMFANAEELAMYAVLMAIVFLTELDGAIKGKKGFAPYVKCISGGAAALFLLWRSGHKAGMVIFALLGALYIPILAARLRRTARKWRLSLQIAAAAAFALPCICALFLGIKHVPQMLGMDISYENELLVTELEGEQREQYLLQFPQSLDGVRTKEAGKLTIIWRAYARRLNLFGHSGGQEAFRRKVSPYNGYLGMAYQHGIFILLPYLAFQVLALAVSIKCVIQKRGSKNVCLLFWAIAFTCFCFCANVEISWGHPLWLCYYLSAGYFGCVEAKKDLGKEGLL